MNKQFKIRAASAAAVVALSSLAFGQARVDPGNALDANPRVGSGGLNSGGTQIPQNRLNNALVTGNVTAGREFRGFVPYGPSRAFRGNLAGQGTDRFVATSSGVIAGQPINNAQVVRPFVGVSEGIRPPAGFAEQGASGGFVPAPLPARVGSDLRLGNVFEDSTSPLPRPGQLLLPGQVDTSNNSVLITASPLYGIRPLNTGVDADLNFLKNYTNVFGDVTRTRRLDDATLERMQQEIDEPGRPGEEPPALLLDNQTNNQALQDATDNSVKGAKPLEPLSADVATGQQVNNRVLLSQQMKQSAQFRELQTRLEKFRAQQQRPTAADATREYNEQVTLKQKMEESARKTAEQPMRPQDRTGGTAGGTLGGAGAAPGSGTLEAMDQPTVPGIGAGIMPGPTRLPGATSNRPTIESFATGLKAKGLQDLMTEAESLMREQKFVSALDKYDAAEQVAPNQPEVLLGRATAELGASYYARAEAHLRQAFTSSPALMMARYDLRKFLGDDRLAFLVKDLKEIANTEKASARPLILLSFIAYNEGNDRMSAGYLDLAEKRIGQKDPFFDAVRKHWELPAYNPAATEENK